MYINTTDKAQSMSLRSLAGSPCTRLRWVMARSKAMRTALRMLEFLPSIIFSLSIVSSMPSGTILDLGSHCLLHRDERQSETPGQQLQVLWRGTQLPPSSPGQDSRDPLGKGQTEPTSSQDGTPCELGGGLYPCMITAQYHLGHNHGRATVLGDTDQHEIGRCQVFRSLGGGGVRTKTQMLWILFFFYLWANPAVLLKDSRC